MWVKRIGLLNTVKKRSVCVCVCVSCAVCPVSAVGCTQRDVFTLQALRFYFGYYQNGFDTLT